MNLQTFKAESMADALSQVKKTMGQDAVILHTRTYSTRYCLGLRKREVVEITAGQGLNVSSRTRRNPGAAAATSPIKPAPAPRVEAPIPGTYGRNPTAARSAVIAEMREAATATHTQPHQLPAPANQQPGRDLLASSAANTVMMASLTTELSSLKAELRSLVTHVRQSQAPSVPEDLFDHYRALIENQVAEELAGQIIKTLQKTVRPEHFTNPDFIRDKIAEQLEKLLPVSGPITKNPRKAGPHIVALIGPTGVGKTTTIAKLAANLKLREGRRIGLVTIDTYRIAAIDQLKKYADIIGSPLKVVSTPADLKDAIAAMADCDYILIDTAGRSPNDALKLQELKNFIAAAAADEVHLVLSSTASQACVELAVNRFSAVRVDKIIFTKLDEAAHVGVVLNVVTKLNKSLSYVTTGQDVPEDIEVGKGRKLAQLILGTASAAHAAGTV